MAMLRSLHDEIPNRPNRAWALLEHFVTKTASLNEAHANKSTIER
jgi:hypothetical protein